MRGFGMLDGGGGVLGWTFLFGGGGGGGVCVMYDWMGNLILGIFFAENSVFFWGGKGGLVDRYLPR